jgi:hypothetical protein
MSDALLSSQDRQEALSLAYLSAIAASAGYTTYKPNPDRDSIDVGVNAGGAMRPNIHVQLKATINLRKSGEYFKYSISRKNYDDLRAETQTPRIMVILALPKKETSWLNVSLQRLIMRRCAFWVSIRGEPELPAEQQSITIAIPMSNTFDVEELKKLMKMSRTGAVT